MARKYAESLGFIASTPSTLCDRKDSNDIKYLRYLHKGKGRQRYPLHLHKPTCISTFFNLFSFFFNLFHFILDVGKGTTPPPPPVHVAECKSYTTCREMCAT